MCEVEVLEVDQQGRAKDVGQQRTAASIRRKTTADLALCRLVALCGEHRERDCDRAPLQIASDEVQPSAFIISRSLKITPYHSGGEDVLGGTEPVLVEC